MAFILLRLLVLGVIAAAADDDNITWLTPPRGVVPCVVADAERLQRGPPPPLEADDRPRAKPYRRRGEDDITKRLSADGSVEVTRRKNGTEGVYQCAVKHPRGIVLGYPQKWKFASMDKQFTRQPQNGTARAGQPYSLSCEVPSAPTASVSWLKDGEKLPHDDRYITLDNQLLFTQIRKEDAGVYKCVATNTYLNKIRISDSAWLSVEDPVDEEPALLKVHGQENITAARYSRVRLLCLVTGWPRPKITWEITDASGRPATLEFTEEELDLTSLELDLEGQYRCSVDGYPHLQKTFNVTVTEPVVITLPPVSKEVIRASTVRFNCTAEGRPTPTVTWYKDGQPLVLGGRANVRSANLGSRYELVVGGVTSADAGIYQCFASSGSSVASGWAALGVGGASAAAPTDVRCWPLNARAVLVRWGKPQGTIMAYTVQTTLPAWPGQPHTNTEETITVSEPLTPYGFQIRAFIKGTGKNVASDMSEPPIFCQGQGVPVQIRKKGDDAVLISWDEFAKETPGVVQWVLQYRRENSTNERNITLPGEVTNYTLPVTPSEPLQVRVLGSKTLDWLPQNLTLLQWSTTVGRDDAGDVVAQDVRITGVWAREFALRWRCDRCESYTFVVCVRKPDGTSKCLDSYNNSATVDGLDPATEYEVEVQARLPGRATGGPFSLPQAVTTLSDGPQQVKDLTWQVIGPNTVRVSWNAPPAKYTVSYSSELKMPVEMWDAVDTEGNTVVIERDPTRDTYVMVKSHDPHVYSPIKTIPAQISEAKDLRYSFTRSGVKVSWKGDGPRVVRYSQNLTHSLDLWPSLNTSGSSIEITNLEPSLPTYVMVAAPGQSQRSQVLTIEPRPEEPSNLYLGVGIAVAVCLLVMLAAAAFCIWRKRKRAGTPLRARRRHSSANDDDDEEAAEMKNVGGRLANGGSSKDAGEPLLNGHVHITENPQQSKTPNGKMKKGRIPFDLSRIDDPDSTLETVLDADTSTASYDLLDTSRPPEDPSLPPNDSFAKLPDDNMNSELTRSSFHTDNSKIQPTLQPNG